MEVRALGNSQAKKMRLAAPPVNPMAGKLEEAKAMGALQANSILKVGELIAENPTEAAALVRSWLNQG